MMRPSSEPTFITLLTRAGIELYKVKRLLGHKSPMMTQCYAHSTQKVFGMGGKSWIRWPDLAQFSTVGGITD